MERKENKTETTEDIEIEGNKLEKQMDKESKQEKEIRTKKQYPSPKVLKKPSPSKSVNFEADKRMFTTFVKVRLEIEGKKEKGVGLNEALMNLMEIMQMGDPSIMWEVYTHTSSLASGKMIREKKVYLNHLSKLRNMHTEQKQRMREEQHGRTCVSYTI